MANISMERLLLCLIKDKIRWLKSGPHRKVNIETESLFVIVENRPSISDCTFLCKWQGKVINN